MARNLFPNGLPNKPAYNYVRETDKLPKIGATPEGADPVVRVKLFAPDGGWTWFLTEHGEDGGDPDLCFGFVVGCEPELGYFSLAELREARGMLGLPIERDVYFKPTPLSEIMAKHDARRAV